MINETSILSNSGAVEDLVSVIVPVYNTERYLQRCVDSIINQTYKNLELILVDDGSPDNAPAICDDYKNRYLNIKVIHKANGGLSSARNAGLRSCKGKFISFVDSDDYIDREMISRLYFETMKYNADVAMVKYMETSSDTVVENITVEKPIVYHNDEIKKAFLTLKIDSVCVGLYRKEIIKNIDFIEGKTSEDIPFNFSIFNIIKTFVYIPEARYYYYYNPNSISNGCIDVNKLNYLYFRKEISEYYIKNYNKELSDMANALYVRAAMGLMFRMALYGYSKELNENELIALFTNVYKKYSLCYYKEKTIPFSRKFMAIVIFNMYSVVRMVGNFYNENIS